MTIVTSLWISLAAFGAGSGALVLGYLLFEGMSRRSELRSP